MLLNKTKRSQRLLKIFCISSQNLVTEFMTFEQNNVSSDCIPYVPLLVPLCLQIKKILSSWQLPTSLESTDDCDYRVQTGHGQWTSNYCITKWLSFFTVIEKKKSILLRANIFLIISSSLVTYTSPICQRWLLILLIVFEKQGLTCAIQLLSLESQFEIYSRFLLYS